MSGNMRSEGVSYGEGYSRFLQDKMRQLEEANLLLRDRLEKGK